MAIKKVIDGQLITIANKSITDHSQLTGNQSYGCHPISAIRKLPEKLHELKIADEKLAQDLESKISTATRLATLINEKANQLDDTFVKVDQNIRKIETDIGKITLSVDGSAVTFTDVYGKQQSFRVGSDTDSDTIENNGEGKITLKKIYADSQDFTGNGIQIDPLKLKIKPDGDSIIINNDNKYEVRSIKSIDGNCYTYQDIINQNLANQNTFSAIQTQFTDVANELIGVDNLIKQNDDYYKSVATAQQSKIADLYTRTQGLGGFLNAYNFGKNPTQEQLTQYALQDTGAADQAQLFNGTKVKNLYDNHVWVLTNTPDSDPVVFSWQDVGEDANISDANNDGVHGLITGSYEHLEGFIDLLGHITINGLSDELNSRVDKSSNESIAGNKTFTGSVIVPDVTIS